VFGRRKREEAAAAEAAREAERRALFQKLAERPEHVCPFLGLADERTGYVDGVSDEHRCFAFGDPAPLSAEQQTRVCQERGYGNCPRYLRGVLVIPTEELEALRRPRAPIEAPAPPPPPTDGAPRRRRASPLVGVIAVLLLVGAGGVAAVALFGEELGIGIATASPTPVTTPSASASPDTSPEASPTGLDPTVHPTASELATPTPEPTPDIGDTFAFYEVSVGPLTYTLFQLDDQGAVIDSRRTSFAAFSQARTAARLGTDGGVYWETQNGDLVGWSYRFPDSGDFRIRAVFLNGAGDRRSAFLEEDQLVVIPQGTPAP
jgi:hypothetical protein